VGVGLEKRIWATLDDYMPPGHGFNCVGRNVVNHQFFQALLRHGHFDEYHFFPANSAHRRLFETHHGEFLESIDALHKVKLFDRLDLPRQMQHCDYTVFHQSDHITFLNSLCYLRNQVGFFPVTAFIHSLSYQSFMRTYLEMSLGGVTSKDTLICSSMNGRRVLEKCFQQIADNLSTTRPPVRMEIIPFGVEGERFCGLERAGCRKTHGLDEREVIGICLGRFSDYDKMDLFPLLQAFQRISRDDRPWRIVLAGALHSESYFKTLQLWAQALRISDKVTFLTNLSESDKAALYGAADFFVSISDSPQETFGLTLVEAMACGLALVVSDFDGYREIVTDDVGLRVATTWSDFDALGMLGPLMDEVTFHRYLGQSVCVDVDQLTDALAFMFSNPVRCREMGEAAQQRFRENYDAPVVIARLEALWVRLKEGFDREPDESRNDPLNMNVFQCFSHYVTQSLRTDMKIQVTPFGQHVLASQVEYPLLPEMASLIDDKVVRAILNQATQPCSVGEVMETSQGEEWKSRYVILWMLKHGLLQCAPENDQGDDRSDVPRDDGG